MMNWPKGTLAVYDWLRKQGVYRQLAETYVSGGWLERVARGVFKRAGDEVDLPGAVYALQTQLGLSIHPGGKTALQRQGYIHYLPFGTASRSGSVSGSKNASVSRSGMFNTPASTANLSSRLWTLFGNSNEKLPAWFKTYAAKVDYAMTNLFGDNQTLGLTEHKTGDYSIKVSSPERAMFEVCYDVPEKVSFEEVSQLMEGLTTFRPSLVQELLQACRSVKTKRLFMYFAEEHQHAWIKKLDLAKVDFGSGKRSLVDGGYYNKKYQLVVPRKDKAA